MPSLKHCFTALLALIFLGCHKQSPEQPQPSPDPANELPIVKLKDMIEEGLPSPYYHFDYSNTGYISNIVFASGLSFYDLTYSNGKIATMLMNKDLPANTKKDKLVYNYENGDLQGVSVFDKNGLLYRKCLLSFSPARQLLQLDWYVTIDNTSFLKEQSVRFSYYPGGNLKTIDYQVFAVGPQVAATYQDLFEDYDAKLNADGFTLLHLEPFFLDLMWLPSVHLQMNNPRRMIHTAGEQSYTIDYSYTYDDENRPVKKSGDFHYTAGENAGKHVSTQTIFTYTE